MGEIASIQSNSQNNYKLSFHLAGIHLLIVRTIWLGGQQQCATTPSIRMIETRFFGPGQTMYKLARLVIALWNPTSLFVELLFCRSSPHGPAVYLDKRDAVESSFSTRDGPPRSLRKALHGNHQSFTGFWSFTCHFHGPKVSLFKGTLFPWLKREATKPHNVGSLPVLTRHCWSS